MREVRYEIHWRHSEDTNMELVEFQAAAFTEDTRRMGWITRKEGLLSVLPSTVHGKMLGVQECRNYLFLLYVIKPPDLTEHCNGFGTAFDICHTSDCNKVGIVTARHNELCDGVSDLAGKALTPTHMPDDPQIYTGRAMHVGKENLKGYPSKDK